jgi:DNA mismatch endonuclease (patch repair protein)
VDTLTREERSRRMGLVRGRDTAPEMTVRKALWASGFRYRIHDKSLPGRPDIVFRGQRTVVFIHGCFWHRHENCALARLPKSRREFWLPKLEGNKERDRSNIKKLRQLGWKVKVVWECEIKAKPDAVTRKLSKALR